jgi:hypothetical protein
MPRTSGRFTILVDVRPTGWNVRVAESSAHRRKFGTSGIAASTLEASTKGRFQKLSESSGFMSRSEFHKIWTDQCDAAEDIRERFGLSAAIEYLVGEKFLNFFRASDRSPDFAAELPSFVARVQEIFEPYELIGYFGELASANAVDPAKKWPFDDLEDAEIEAQDVVDEAGRIILIERAREFLS